MVQRLHHGSFLADEAWGRTCFATCPFQAGHALFADTFLGFSQSINKVVFLYLIWRNMAQKDARQEELLSTLQACTNCKNESPQMPPKTRDGLNHHLPQIGRQDRLKMLVYGSSGKFSGMVEASRPSGSSSRRHASGFSVLYKPFY